MQTDIVISGFGGQGVLFAGQLLAYTALENELFVTWIPSYGPEMRGGTAHCTVIVSDDEIGSPLVRNPRAAVVMNLPSLDKYEDLVVPGGVMVVNSSLIEREVARTDIDVIKVPANEVAEELGNIRLANMVILGALVTYLKVFSLDSLGESLKLHLPERHQHLVGKNLEAMRRGAAIAEEFALATA